MKKFLAYTTIFLLIGILFYSFSNTFVEEEKEVVITPKTEQITISNIYLVKSYNNANQKIIPVKRKILKDKIYENTIKALLAGPTENELQKGFLTEIPNNTSLIGLGEYDNVVIVNLSTEFESGGGSDSMTMRLNQLANTVSDMTEKPVYLYIGGKEISVLGGDGIMVKQPINVTK